MPLWVNVCECESNEEEENRRGSYINEKGPWIPVSSPISESHVEIEQWFNFGAQCREIA
jgi:hypothetical protein